jgi:argininosuccinate lyase
MPYSKDVIEFHRYTPGVPEAPEWHQVLDKYMNYVRTMEKDPTKHSTGPNRLKVDLVWIVCMLEAEIIDAGTAEKLLRAVRSIQDGAVETLDTKSHGYAERNMVRALGNDEDLASMVNLGRTLQEPMNRLDMRNMLNDTFDEVLDLLSTLLSTVETNIDTIMPGHTHFSQAQPITLAHYLLSVYDSLRRAYDQLALAYRDTNRNSGGCGATSGITWPIDRDRMTELLGFDDVVEPAYDSEASQDHSMSILFGLTNLVTILSKTAMDMCVWALEEVDMIRAEPAWCGVSSMMPNKCIPSSLFERTRIEAGYVIGEMMEAAVLVKGEPHGDVLPMLEAPKIALKAMAHAMVAMGYMNNMLKHIIPQKERMLEYVRAGFSCSTEVAYHIVKESGCGPRRAHRIVATMVRMARERGLKAYEVTGELLDEAAAFAEEKPPRLSTERLRELLDPETFIKTHNNKGGTAPQEARRMLAKRRRELGSVAKEHQSRRKKITDAESALNSTVDSILGA